MSQPEGSMRLTLNAALEKLPAPLRLAYQQTCQICQISHTGPVTLVVVPKKKRIEIRPTVQTRRLLMLSKQLTSHTLL